METSSKMDPGGAILGAGERLKLCSPYKMHAETGRDAAFAVRYLADSDRFVYYGLWSFKKKRNFTKNGKFPFRFLP